MAFRLEAREAGIVHYHFPWPFADVMHCFRCWQRSSGADLPFGRGGIAEAGSALQSF